MSSAWGVRLSATSWRIESDHGCVEVVFLPGERQAAQRIAQRLLGRNLALEDYAGLAGAPDGAQVEVGVLRGRLYLELWDPVAAAYHGHYYLCRKPAATVLLSVGFSINIQAMRRCGIGLGIFHRQVAVASALGVDRIEAVAGRQHGENGYYTWPRYGFDGRLPAVIRRRLPLELQSAHTVLDLMSYRQGRAWWAMHGIALRVQFDLMSGSRSQRTLAEYVHTRMPISHILTYANNRQNKHASSYFEGVSSKNLLDAVETSRL